MLSTSVQTQKVINSSNLNSSADRDCAILKNNDIQTLATTNETQIIFQSIVAQPSTTMSIENNTIAIRVNGTFRIFCTLLCNGSNTGVQLYDTFVINIKQNNTIIQQKTLVIDDSNAITGILEKDTTLSAGDIIQITASCNAVGALIDGGDTLSAIFSITNIN